MEEEGEHWYRAVESRDGRFDGWIYLGVTSTGVYCRPSCPAVSPKRANMRFYRSSAAAQRAGFRACKRCPLVGGPERIVNDLGTLAEAGVMRVMAQWLDMDDIDGLELIATKVIPQLG